MRKLTEKEIELITEMGAMQEALDKAIYEEHKVEPTMWQYQFAIVDEVGELIHELKSEWCWWKKSQTPVDYEKVKMELVDIWHFVLGYCNNFSDNNYRKINRVAVCTKDVTPIKDIIFFVNEFSKAAMNDDFILHELIDLTHALNLSIEDVYKAYIEKNKINYERLANNY